MIGSFTYETIGFNPTLLLVIAVPIVVLGIALIVYGDNTRKAFIGSLGIVIFMLGGGVSAILTIVPEIVRVTDFKTDSVEQNREATFAQLGYTEVQTDGDTWSASYNGEYASGSLKLIEDKKTYEIYKFESK